ncbi:MAG: ferrous iron transport protein B [Flavobacteriales bacterium]|nr:ferrous iron transport protein B [Flavobacteriales bacterium]
MSLDDRKTYVFTGAPNSGKSTIFNRLTGLRQRVGNYPGVTVDRLSGILSLNDVEVELVDLPGCYSLYPSSADERIVLEVLLGLRTDIPNGVIHVLNAAHLERSLLLLSQVIDLGIPSIALLNMGDLAENEGLLTDAVKLSDTLGIEVIPVNGRTGEGFDRLEMVLEEGIFRSGKPFFPDTNAESELIDAIQGLMPSLDRYGAQLLAVQGERIRSFDWESLQNALPGNELNPIRVEVEDKKQRLAAIQDRTDAIQSRTGKANIGITERLDALLTHKIWGLVIFLFILFLLFQSIFTWAEPLMDLIDEGMFAVIQGLRGFLPAAWYTDLICDGILAGVGGIVIFIPQIAILFGLIALLEESGYMTRAVFLSDKLMRKSGLNGRSLVSLISGVACAVPAIMASRTIPNWKERLITIFVTPFMSCSARLPVYIVLIALVIPADQQIGIFSMQGVVMFGLYILGAVAAILLAYVMKKVLKTDESGFLMLEMPPYQVPQWRNVLLTMYEKSRVFVWEAGKIILVISIILWTLASFGPSEQMAAAEKQVETMLVNGEIPEEEYERYVEAYRLEASYVGHLGKAIEPSIRPLGFDWKIGIALITSFAAREVFVGTMATIYSAGSEGDEYTLIERMRSERDIRTGELVFTPIRALSLLLFYVFAMQCMSTLAIVKRETRSWTIPLLQFLVMTGTAYVASLAVWQIFGT